MELSPDSFFWDRSIDNQSFNPELFKWKDDKEYEDFMNR